MNTTAIAHQAQLQLWANRFKDHQEGGLSVEAWCSLNKVSKNTYYYWKRQLKEACLDACLPDIVPLAPLSVPAAIANDVSLNGCTSCTTCATLGTAIKISISDVNIEFSSDVSFDQLTNIIKAVRNA